MDLDSAKAMQLLPCDFWVACSECGAETRFDGMRANTRADKSCHSCFAHLSFGFASAVLEEVRVAASKGEGGGGRASVRDAAGKKVKMAIPNGLLEGTPLPDKGACKHFRRSRRWLCFPCCGRAYPCPACHDEKVAGEHVAEWATRMICGKCSREMPYSDAPCAHCGNVFAHQSAAHWNGGGGCRDQQRLSTKDSRKHKGANVAGVKKTTSGKSQRVGAAGKKAVAAKVASRAE